MHLITTRSKLPSKPQSLANHLTLNRIAFANVPQHSQQIPQRRRLELFVGRAIEKIASALLFDRRHDDQDVNDAPHVLQSEAVIVQRFCRFDVPVPDFDEPRHSAEFSDHGIDHGGHAVEPAVASTVNLTGEPIEPLSNLFCFPLTLIRGVAVAADRVPPPGSDISEAKMLDGPDHATLAATTKRHFASVGNFGGFHIISIRGSKDFASSKAASFFA